MREVETSAEYESSPSDIHDELDPKSIIEYEGTFLVREVTESDGGWLVNAVSKENNVEMEVFIEELPDGYTYELREGGFFDELRTTILIREGDDGTQVTVSSEFTFGGRLARLYDWLGAEDRQMELDRMLLTLAVELEEIKPPDGYEGLSEQGSGEASEPTSTPEDETETTSTPENDTKTSSTPGDDTETTSTSDATRSDS